MITVTFYKEDKLVLGVKTDKGILDVESAIEKYPQIKSVPQTVAQVVSLGKEGQGLLEELITKANDDSSLFLDEKSLSFGPCVPEPQKIICVGLNYKKHADETKMAHPTTPILFSKFANTLTGHNAVVQLPASGTKYDYEAELVIVMGKETKDVEEDEALSYVYGYCNGNDLSIRDLQLKTSQWLLGKTADDFCPIGPYLVSGEQIDPDNLNVSITLNGKVRQNSNSSDMIFNCSEIVSYISKHMTLYPGDIILTGTPEGVIMGDPEDQQVWLKDGDETVVEIEKLGSLTTRFKG